MPGSESGSAGPDSIRSDLQAFAVWTHALASLSGGRHAARALPLFERAAAWFAATHHAALAVAVDRGRARALAALSRDAWIDAISSPTSARAVDRPPWAGRALADLRAEHAETLVLYAQALAQHGRDDQARLALRGARWLFSKAGLAIAAARVRLIEAERDWVAGQVSTAAEAALDALPVLDQAAEPERALEARWLLGHVLNARGARADALEVLLSVLAEAESANVPRVVRRCRVSLGQLAAQAGDTNGVRRELAAAIDAAPTSNPNELGVRSLSRILRRVEETFGPANTRPPLGVDTALVEYFSLDGALLALVLTDGGPRLVLPLCSEHAAAVVARALRFQVASMACGSAALRRYTFDLARRTRHHLARLYDLLVRPLEQAIGQRHLVIAPHAALQDVPFHALFDGSSYLIESREVALAPGSGGAAPAADGHPPRHSPRRAVLVAPSAARHMHFVAEVRALEPLFDDVVTLLGPRATLPDLRQRARGADVVHVAYPGWLTPQTAARLDLNGALITLSSTRDDAWPSEVASLTRALLLAGASNVVASLWNMDDDASVEVLSDFYLRLRAGDRPAAALRHAQRRMLQVNPHPFFWASMALTRHP
jgi:CHAT domain